VTALAPDAAPARLLELSDPARAVVLLDAAGARVASAGIEAENGRELAELGRELFLGADEATPEEPAEQVEAVLPGGAVFALRSPRWTFAMVARRSALSSLAFMDMRAVLAELDGVRTLREARPGVAEPLQEEAE
jgi:hypothetical protein